MLMTKYTKAKTTAKGACMNKLTLGHVKTAFHSNPSTDSEGKS